MARWGVGKGRASRDAASPPSHWLPVCVARRRVSSGLCRRAPHPRRQSAWVSSGESLFGTLGANRSTKLASASGLRLCRGSTGPWQREWLLNPTLYLPNFLERWEGGETMSTTKACVYGHASLRSVDVHTMQSYVVSAGYECWRRTGAAQGAEHCSSA